MVFVDLEKTSDRVLRVLIESSLKRKGVAECYVWVVMKMYKEVLSQVKAEGEDSKEFAVRVGIHQGSIFSPFIFAVMMYADDLVLICERRKLDRDFSLEKCA